MSFAIVIGRDFNNTMFTLSFYHHVSSREVIEFKNLVQSRDDVGSSTNEVMTSVLQSRRDYVD